MKQKGLQTKGAVPWGKYLCFGLFVVLIECLFFRNILGNGNLIGSDGDARYIDLILEHYYRWLCGEENFTDLRCFYPVTNTVSYSDMLLGLAVPFCALRALGASMFTANKIGLILIHCFGTVCTMRLLDKRLKLRPVAVLIGTVVFSYANALSVKSWHNQMLAVCFVPFFLLCLDTFFTHLDKRCVRRYLAGGGAIAVLALLFYTSFYNAFYLLIFGCCLIVAYIVMLKRRKVAVFTGIGGFLKKNWLEALCYCVFGIAIMLPFLKIYLPTLRQSGGWDWDVTRAMLPTWRDYFNVSPYNAVYGAFMDGSFFKLEGFYAGELRTGFPLVTFVLFWIALFGMLRLTGTKKVMQAKKRTEDWYRSLLITAIGVATVCCFVLMLKVHGYSLWYLIYRFVPGASGVRAVCRFNMFLTLPVAIVTAWYANELLPKINLPKPKKWLACVGLIAFLILENTQTVGVRSLWNRADAQALTADVSAPPTDCDVFFLSDSAGDFSKDDKGYQLVAWEIAYRYNLRVINGHSGQFPPDWKHMSPIHGTENYETAINRWIATYSLTHVYCYDIATNEWALWDGSFQ